MQKIHNLDFYANTEIGTVEDNEAILKAILAELQSVVDATKGLSMKKGED